MFFYYNSTYLVLIFVTFFIGVVTTIWCKSRLSKYRKKANLSCLSGADIASRMLNNYGVKDVEVYQGGEEQDFFNPKNNSISLSSEVFNESNITSIAVACHEAGHACQYAEKYVLIKIRNSFVPIVNSVSNIWPLLIIAGIVLKITGLIWLAIGLYAFAVLFHLITLPVEFNASNRAIKFLKNSGLSDDKEISGARSVLRACALTYVSAALISILNLIYYLSFLTGNDD